MSKRRQKYYLLFALAIANIMIYLAPWASLMGYKQTLWGIASNLGTAGSFLEYSEAQTFATIIKVATIFALGFLVLSVVLSFMSATDSHRSDKVCHGFIGNVVLSIAFCILIESASNEVYDAYTVTAWPIIGILVSIAAIVIDCAMKTESESTRMDSKTSTYSEPTRVDSKTSTYSESTRVGSTMLPVVNYYPHSKWRITHIAISSDTKVSLRLVSYSIKMVPTDVRVSIELQTLFNDSRKIGPVPFKVMGDATGAIFQTDEIDLGLHSYDIGTLRAAQVIIENSVPPMPSAWLSEPATISDINILEDIKLKYGSDAVQEYSENKNGWKCPCGADNTSHTSTCECCNRTTTWILGRNRTWEQKSIIRQMMPDLEKMGRASEMLSYLQGALRNMPDAGEYQKLLNELEKFKDIEKYRSVNQRDDALNVLRKYCTMDYPDLTSTVVMKTEPPKNNSCRHCGYVCKDSFLKTCPKCGLPFSGGYTKESPPKFKTKRQEDAPQGLSPLTDDDLNNH